MPNTKVPIIIGVGDVRNKSFNPDDAIEPAKLMVQAIRNAVADSGLNTSSQQKLLSSVDALRVIPTWTWSYNDLPSNISQALGIKPALQEMPSHGGNQPALQCDEAARQIATGKSKVAVLTGGEALASRKSLPELSFTINDC